MFWHKYFLLMWLLLLYQFCENYQCVVDCLFMCFLFKCSIDTSKTDQGITIWWAKFDFEFLLLIYISIQKSKKLAKTQTLNADTLQLIHCASIGKLLLFVYWCINCPDLFLHRQLPGALIYFHYFLKTGKNRKVDSSHVILIFLSTSSWSNNLQPY